MPANTCQICAATFRPTAGHCTGGVFGGCCRSFASTGGFDRHRRFGVKGDWETRYCAPDAVLLAEGWARDASGFWHVPVVAELEPIFRQRVRKVAPE